MRKVRNLSGRGATSRSPASTSGRRQELDDPAADAVLRRIYRELLQRDLDEPGRQHWLRAMRNGLPPADVAIAIATSEEYTNRIAAERFFLPDLRELRPDRYREARIEGSNDTLAVFQAETPADLDWLEHAILDNGYYNKPGIWMNEVNLDKRVMAELIAGFAPARPLEVGCSTGAVLRCLLDLGIRGEGIEISSRAKRDAHPEVRDAIHLGDLLTADLPAPYDLVFGLDVFEHLNPNRLVEYIDAIRRVLAPTGWLFCNIPAFGHDDVFGEVFPLQFASWRNDAAAGRPFADLQVDDNGYPMHGHLIWAGSSWWVEQFEHAGFHRQPSVERALHDKYDRFFDTHAPARKSFFVFSPDQSPDWGSVVARIGRAPSAVLDGALLGAKPAVR